jgi:hypothetical protein
MKIINKRFVKHLTEVEISSYANHLSLDSLSLIQEKQRVHVEDCDECRNKIISIMGFIEKAEVPVVKETKHTFNFKKNYKILAVACSLLLFVFLPLNLTSSFFSNNLVLNEELEALVGLNYRTTNISLLEPLAVDELSKKILFKLNDTPTEEVFLYVLDNAENILIEEQFTSRELEVEILSNIKLVYWKIESNDDLLFVGKLTR